MNTFLIFILFVFCMVIASVCAGGTQRENKLQCEIDRLNTLKVNYEREMGLTEADILVQDIIVQQIINERP